MLLSLGFCFVFFLLSWLTSMEEIFLIFHLEGRSLIANILGDKQYKNLRKPQLSICDVPFNTYNIQCNILHLHGMSLLHSVHSSFPREEMSSLLPGWERKIAQLHIMAGWIKETKYFLYELSTNCPVLAPASYTSSKVTVVANFCGFGRFCDINSFVC